MAHLYLKLMRHIALCLCGFEPSTERQIQAASAGAGVTPGLGGDRAGNGRESDIVGHWRASLPVSPERTNLIRQ